MTVWLTDTEHMTLTALLDEIIPGDDHSPGAGAAGGADYIDQLLGAFTFDPPRIWAGGPFSGRNGGEARFDQWLSLGRVEEVAWRTRLEGSSGIAEREFNGPVIGWQSMYRGGLATYAATGSIDALDTAFRELIFTHACEALYGDPVYGGNRDTVGWRAIGHEGDTQPRGFTDAQVEGRS